MNKYKDESKHERINAEYALRERDQLLKESDQLQIHNVNGLSFLSIRNA